MPAKRPRPARQLKRYAGCRFYDPESKTYLSVEDLERLTARGVRIAVRDVATGQDVTHELVSSHVH